MNELENLRYRYWRKGFTSQHSVQAFKDWIGDLWQYSDIRHGDVKKGQGDIVIINLKPSPIETEISLFDYLSHTKDIDRIEKKGIYTNIYFGCKFFSEVIKEINNHAL